MLYGALGGELELKVVALMMEIRLLFLHSISVRPMFFSSFVGIEEG